MMTTHKTNRSAAWKYALAVPIAIGLVVFFSSSTVKQKMEDVDIPVNDTIPIPPPAPPTHISNALMPDGVKAIVVEKEFLKVDLNGGVSKYYYRDNPSDIKTFENFYGKIPTCDIIPPVKEVLKVADQMPRFPGCEHLEGFEKTDCSNRNLLQYVYTHIKYPKTAKDLEISGPCIAQFVIATDGSVSDVKIIKSPHPSIAEEVTNMVLSMNDNGIIWIPGLNNGSKVNILYTLPVKFSLDEKTPTKPNQEAKDHSMTKVLNDISNMAFFNKTAQNDDPLARWGESIKLTNMFISQNLKYPKQAKEHKIEGKCIVIATIDKDGKLKNAKIKEDIGYGCGVEAIRIVRLMPSWIPATKDGEPVESVTEIPILFTLSPKTTQFSEKPSDVIFNIFPNPTSDWIKINIEGLELGPAELKIYDFYGKELLSKKLNINDSKHNESMDISQLKTEVIVVQILQGDLSLNKRVILKK